MKNIGVPFVLIVLVFSGVAAGVALSQNDGDALYRKHCILCHPDAAKLRSSKDIISLMRNPPIPEMPAFGEEKLSDGNAKAIADFIRGGVLSVTKIFPSDVTSTTTPTAPPPTAGLKTVPVIDAPAPIKVEPKKPPREIKPKKDKKEKTRSFAKSWSIKSLQNGEVITIQKFEITVGANDEFAVVPLTTLADYAVKVAAFDILEKSLKLRLSWTWKNAPSYWKIETYELTLSDDGKKLSGSYNRRANSGENVVWSVWGE